MRVKINVLLTILTAEKVPAVLSAFHLHFLCDFLTLKQKLV